MATLGSTAEPTTGQVSFGLNTTNHHAILLAMPAGGPWEISRVGAWCAGWGEVTNVRVCVWSAGGTLLGRTGVFSLASMALAIGNNTKAEADLESPVTVDGGTNVYVGIARDPADNTQFGTRSGTRLDKYSATWPASIAGGSSVSGAIGAYIADYHSSNVAPSAPVGRTPFGNEVVNTGRTITYRASMSDPDAGDYITAAEVQVWNDGHTTLLQTVGVPITGKPGSYAYAITLPSGYNADRFYEWRTRTRDSGNLWSPWSSYARFRANSVPNTPPAPTVDTDTLTPNIGGVFTDPDPGNTISKVYIHVERVDTGTDMWVPGELPVTVTPWSIPYAGAVLSWGVKYRARYWVRDNYGAGSSWGAFREFTPVQPIGPSAMTPRTESPRQMSLTPTLTVAQAATFRNDEVEVYAGSTIASTRLWAKTWDAVDYAAVTTKARPYGTGGGAATPLAWGSTYYWRARIEDAAGAISAWSNLYPFRINALPTAPVVTAVYNGVSLEQAVRNPAGVFVTSDSTPAIDAPFTDPDTGEGDAASARHWHVRRKDTGALHQEATTGTTGSFTVSTPLLADVVYEVRMGYRDAAGQPAGTYVYGPWAEVKYSGKPVVATVAPTAGAAVPESTPLLDWNYTSAGGKAQTTHQVLLYDQGPVGAPIEEVQVHDSGLLGGLDTAYTVPPGIIQNGRQYRWEVRVTDSDGLPGVLA